MRRNEAGFVPNADLAEDMLVLARLRDPCIGRDSDLETLAEKLAETRLVTVAGAPGIGKTRVAIEFASRHADDYEHVVMVPLAGADSLGGAIATMSTALDLELPALAEASLPAHLAREIARLGRALIVLDNFEQLVLTATALVDEILNHAPRAHVIVTSRQRLRLSAEWVHELRPLSTSSAQSDAVKLLAERVRKLRGSIALGEAELSQLASVAERLEGMPLALELAAVRISTLGAGNVLGRLDSALDVLTTNLRDTSAHHASLKEAVGRSFRLLDESETAVLTACSVFRGGFDLNAASKLIDSEPLLGALHELCEKSLVSVNVRTDASQRFSLYESVRQFAEALLEPSRRRQLWERHARHYAEAGTQLMRAAEGRDAGNALDLLASEQDNLLAVAARSGVADSGVSPAHGIQALLALVPLALARGPIASLAEKLDATLANAVGLQPELRMLAHAAAARCFRRLGAFERGYEHQERALALAEASDDPAAIGRLKSGLAMTLLAAGELSAVRELLAQAVELHQSAGDDAGVALDRLRIGMVLREQGALESARDELMAAASTFERLGNPAQAGLSHAELAHVAINLSDRAAAHAAIERARKSTGASGLTDAAVMARAGMLAHESGELDEAETLLQAALIGLRRVGYRRFEAGVTGYLGVLELERGRLDTARSRFEAALRLSGHELRVRELISAWLGVADPDAPQEAATPLNEADPVSVATHLLRELRQLSPGQALKEWITEQERLGLAARSYDVRLPLRVARSLGRVGASAPRGGLEVASSGDWFRVAGQEIVECRRFRSLRRILVKLVEQRLLKPGETLPAAELIEAGWPAERIREDAAKKRLKVAISTLRKMGLRNVLLSGSGGYRLAESVPVVVASE